MKARYQDLLYQTLLAVYRGLAEYGSVTPARRHRAEGFAAAGLTLELIAAKDLAELLERAHQDGMGESFLDRQGMPASACIDSAARTLSLPCCMDRAPVWPTTSD